MNNNYRYNGDILYRGSLYRGSTVHVCCSQLLLSGLNSFQLYFQHTPLLNKFPGVFAHPCLPLSPDLVNYFLAGGSIHFFDLTPLLFNIQLCLLVIIRSTFWSLSLYVQYFLYVDLGFFTANSFILTSATTRWWSDHASALRLTLVSYMSCPSMFCFQPRAQFGSHRSHQGIST